jgi:hypothetical protein
MAWAREHWYLWAFFAAEIFWIAVLMMILSARKGQPDPVPGVKEPIRGWRLVEVFLIFYHFPIILGSQLLGGKWAPNWAVYGITPLLYTGIALLFR